MFHRICRQSAQPIKMHLGVVAINVTRIFAEQSLHSPRSTQQQVPDLKLYQCVDLNAKNLLVNIQPNREINTSDFCYPKKKGVEKEKPAILADLKTTITIKSGMHDRPPPSPGLLICPATEVHTFNVPFGSVANSNRCTAGAVEIELTDSSNVLADVINHHISTSGDVEVCDQGGCKIKREYSA